jgi:hypothetical protein
MNRKYFFFIKCALFDRAKIDAPTSAINSSSFTLSSKASIKDGLKVVQSSPFQTVFVIDEAKKKSIFAITQNIDLVNESRKPKGGGGGGGGPPLPPDPVSECCNTCIAQGASGCLLLENMDCWCLYTDGGATGPRDIDTNDDLGSILRVAP